MLHYTFVIHTLEAMFLIVGIILVGYISSKSLLTDKETQKLINSLAFTVATPALIFLIAASADPTILLSPIHLAYTAPLIACGLIASAIFLTQARLSQQEKVFGISATVWMNANNLGLPLAVYALKLPELLVPLILFQWLVVSPVIHFLLKTPQSHRLAETAPIPQPLSNTNTHSRFGRHREHHKGAFSFRNLIKAVLSPMTVAALAGVAVSFLEWELPDYIFSPVEILSSAAIVLMLLAFGMNLGLPEQARESGQDRRFIATVVLLKSLLMPIATFFIAAIFFELEGTLLFGVTLIAALPTAQSLNLLARRIDVLVTPAKITVILTTATSAGIILLAAFFAENLSLLGVR